MAEELRFFLRTALYALAAGTIYWFVSYEWAGTFLFGFVVVGATFFSVAVASLIRETRSETIPAEGEPVRRNRAIETLDRTLGFEEHPGDAVRAPLAVEEEPIPPSSIWPVVAALTATMTGLGLIYGPWFWIPGALMAVATTYGWVTELTD